MAVQQAPYQLLEQDGMFEIRYYEPLILAISPETDLRDHRDLAACSISSVAIIATAGKSP
jgi:hypothetical protein